MTKDSPAIDVFQRLAKIRHESDSRLQEIERLQNEQRSSDCEFDKVEGIATDMLTGVGDCAILVKVWDKATSEHADYCIGISDGRCKVFKVIDLSDIPAVTEWDCNETTDQEEI